MLRYLAMAFLGRLGKIFSMATLLFSRNTPILMEGGRGAEKDIFSFFC